MANEVEKQPSPSPGGQLSSGNQYAEMKRQVFRKNLRRISKQHVHSAFGPEAHTEVDNSLCSAVEKTDDPADLSGLIQLARRNITQGNKNRSSLSLRIVESLLFPASATPDSQVEQKALHDRNKIESSLSSLIDPSTMDSWSHSSNEGRETSSDTCASNASDVSSLGSVSFRGEKESRRTLLSRLLACDGTYSAIQCFGFERGLPQQISILKRREQESSLGPNPDDTDISARSSCLKKTTGVAENQKRVGERFCCMPAAVQISHDDSIDGITTHASSTIHTTGKTSEVSTRATDANPVTRYMSTLAECGGACEVVENQYHDIEVVMDPDSLRIDLEHLQSTPRERDFESQTHSSQSAFDTIGGESIWEDAQLRDDRNVKVKYTEEIIIDTGDSTVADSEAMLLPWSAAWI